MRYALLADIHGNLPALEAVLADIRGRGCDAILSAGDQVSGCPFPRETLDLLRSLPDCQCIRGNNESYLLDFYQRTCQPWMLTSCQWGFTRWAYEQLTPAGLEWIARLPAQLSLVAGLAGGGLRVVHGSPRSENEGLVPDRQPEILEKLRRIHILRPGRTPPSLSEMLALVQETVLVCGHFHIPWMQAEGARLVLNPGSVGVPNHGDWRAQYALLEWRRGEWQVEFHAVSYDLQRTLDAFASSGLLEAGGAFARAYRQDVRNSTNTLILFLNHASALARRRGIDQPPIPDAVWQEAESTFAWNPE